MKHNHESINTDTKIEFITALIEKLKACYVFPELAEQISAHLQESLQNGVFEDLKSGSLFALALTMHLQEVNHDEHLWVRWHQEALPEDADALRLDPAWQAARKEEAQLDHYGFHKLERLPGNIGYQDIRYFRLPAWVEKQQLKP